MEGHQMATIYCAYENYYRVRSLALGMKQHDSFAIHRIAHDLKPLLSGDCILIPIPNRNGFAENTLSLAKMICKLRPQRTDVADILKGCERRSLYDCKKSHQQRVESYFGFYLSGVVPANKRILLVDNMLATGLTASAALELLPGADILVHSIAAAALKESVYLKNFSNVVVAMQETLRQRQKQRIRL